MYLIQILRKNYEYALHWMKTKVIAYLMADWPGDFSVLLISQREELRLNFWNITQQKIFRILFVMFQSWPRFNLIVQCRPI